MTWWQTILSFVTGWALVMATGWLKELRDDRRYRRERSEKPHHAPPTTS